MNGKAKIMMGVVTLLLSFFGGAVTSAYYFGGINRSINNHISDPRIHESQNAKEARIDGRVKLHLAPLLVELREINKRLERMESK